VADAGSTRIPGTGRHTIARAAVFLDRDGVIIENRTDYVKSWKDVHFLTGALEALQRLARSEYSVVVVTNQSVVGRGIISLEQAMEINHRLMALIEAQAGRIDATYLCPHRPDEGCDCRKPAPGLLLRAAREMGLDLTRSYMIGDAVTDIEASRAAGVSPILVLTGRGAQEAAGLEAGELTPCPVLGDLGAAVDLVLGSHEVNGTCET
jgi:D-glycero-D-manno-heptose 1,7-bisphosphate phosphatase